MSILSRLAAMASDARLAEPLTGAPMSAYIPKLGREVSALPDARLGAVAEMYAQNRNIPYDRPSTWANIVPSDAREYARAYDEMRSTPNDPLVDASWRRMGAETLDQLDALHDAGYKFEFNPRGFDPYAASPRLALEDLRDNRHLWIFPTEDGYGTINAAGASPLLEIVRGRGHLFGGAPFVMNDAFRVVHDALGHAPIGAGFRAGGEENAFRHHARLYSDLARPAVTAETRGQNSWVNYGPYAAQNRGASGADTIYADQKIGLMPDFVYNRGLEDLNRPISTDELRRRLAMLAIYAGGGGALLTAGRPGGIMSALEDQPASA